VSIKSLVGDSSASSYQNVKLVKPIYSGEKIEANDSSASVKIKSEKGSIAKIMTENESEKDGNPSTDAKEKIQQKQASTSSMKSASKSINNMINMNTVAEFGFFEDTNRIIIKIKDKTTNEVIKEIPSEKALEILLKAWEASGMLVDEKR